MARTLTYYAPQYVSDGTTPTLKIVFGDGTNHLEVVDGLGAPDMQAVDQPLPLQNGSQFSRAQYEPRIITIEGKLIGTITTQNTNKAAMAHALAFNNLAVKETWMSDFWRLKAADSGIDTVTEFIDFLFNTGGLGILKYTSSGISVTKRINAVPNKVIFKNKDGREPFQAFQVQFYCPSPFWEDDEYTLAIDEEDDSKTVDFTIAGDVPPRMVLHVEPTSATVSNNLELTITAKQNYTPTIAASGYVPTMIDLKSTANLRDNELMYQSFINGEKQMYIDRSANKFAVAVGSGVSTDPIAITTNGTSWSFSTYTTGVWRSIAYAPSLNLFVAVGATSPYIITSVDGINWSAASSPGTGTGWSAVAWSPSLARFVVVGSVAPFIATSTNGQTWTTATTVAGTQLADVVWAPELGRFIAPCTGGAITMITSTDGLNWYSVPSSPTYMNRVAWAPSLRRFVAVGAAAGGPYFITSQDGINWTTVTSPPSGTLWYGIAWSQTLNLFVAVGGTPYFATSPDGLVWTVPAGAVGPGWNNVSWSNVFNLFITVGVSSPFIVSSPDGNTWTNATITPAGGAVYYDVASFPEPDQGPDTNSKLTRFKALECPPGSYRATILAGQSMKWKLYYRKAYLGV